MKDHLRGNSFNLKVAKNAQNSFLSSEHHLDRPGSWIVVLAAFGGLFLGVGVPRSFSVFFEPLRELYDVNRSAILSLSLLYSFTCHLLGFVTGPLAEKFGRRVILIAGGLVGCVSLVVCSFAPNYWLLLAFYSIGVGSSLSLVFYPSISLLGHHFKRLLPLATSLVTLSIPLGSLVLPKVFTWILPVYDIQGTLLISGAVFLHICICGALMRPAPAPVPFPAPALASSAKLVLKERVILDRYPSAPPDASRDADIVHSYEPPKHMNGTSTEHENEKVEESSLISPPVKSNALNDPNASTSIPQTGSSTSKPLDYPVHSDAQPKNADSATISTRMNTLTTGNKSSWLRSTLRDYWNLIRVMHFFTFVLSVNIAIGSNMMILTPLVSYLNVERGYTADEASNALLTLNLGEVCGRLMGTVFVTLLPLLRARRRVPRASATKTIIAPKTTGASDSDTTKDKSTAAATPTATATATSTSHKKDLLHRALSFSNVFVSSFLLNCVLLTSYCLLGFLHRDSVLFAPFGYAILIVYGLFYGVIMTLYPIVAAELVGRKKLSTAFGLVSVFGPIFIAGIPFAGGVLRDLSGTWRFHFAIAATQLLFAFLLSLYSAVAISRRKRHARRLTIARATCLGNEPD